MSAALEGEIVDRDAIEIGEQYRLAKQSAQEVATRLLTVGHRLLVKQRALKVAGVKWGAWLSRNEATLGFGERAAQQIMAVTHQTVTRLNLPSVEDPKLAAALPGLELDDDTAKAVVTKGWGHSVPHGTQTTGINEWYTPAKYIEAVRAVLGHIELDPATSKAAQETVKAERYFTIENDALAHEWVADTVFMNPPYSTEKVYDFIKKLIDELQAGNVGSAILLTNALTDTAWFHVAEEISAAICFTRGRIKFIKDGEEGASPTFGQAFFYFGEEPELFKQHFLAHGFIR